jgi:hypothetical protein
MCDADISPPTDEFPSITAPEHYSGELRRPSRRADDRIALCLLVFFLVVGTFTWTSVFIGFDPVAEVQAALEPPAKEDFGGYQNVIIICGIGYINSQQDYLVVVGFISLLTVTVVLARSSPRRRRRCDE